MALVAVTLEHWPAAWRRSRESALVVLAACLAVTVTVPGHGGVNGWFTFVVDVAHVAAAAAWTGGLAVLLIAIVLTSAGMRWSFAARAVPRFSTLAVGSVAVLLVAGVVNAYLEVRVWRGLWQTTYGRLVLVKVVLVLPLLALGAFNNRMSVPRLQAGIASVVERRRFLGAITAELVLLVTVVVVTAALVDEAPARGSLPEPKSTSVRTTVGPFPSTIVITPAEAGSNEVSLAFDGPNGRPAALAEVDLAASLPAQKIGPLRFTARRISPGHYLVRSAMFAIPGNWRLRLTVRRGEFDEWLQTIQVRIRKGT